MSKTAKSIVRLQFDACTALELLSRAKYAFDHGQISREELDKAEAKNRLAQSAFNRALAA